MAGAEDEGAVELRRGFETFTEAMGNQGWKLGLVSVNWSGRFVKGVLGGLDSSAVADMDILANEFRNGTIEGPEEVGRPLLTAHDKLEALVRVWEKQGKRGTVYIGDSLTDLDCLLSAHLSIVISDSDEGNVVQTLRRLNHVVPHVTDARLWFSKIVWARDFAEIGESGILDDWVYGDNK
jgi:phosphoserine phosphatase